MRKRRTGTDQVTAQEQNLSYGLVFLTILGTVACGSSTPEAGPTTACLPGKQEACACPGGTQGAQVCAADGNSYGACSCPDSGLAEAGGSGVGDGSVDAADVSTIDTGASGGPDGSDGQPDGSPPPDAEQADAYDREAIADLYCSNYVIFYCYGDYAKCRAGFDSEYANTSVACHEELDAQMLCLAGQPATCLACIPDPNGLGSIPTVGACSECHAVHFALVACTS